MPGGSIFSQSIDRLDDASQPPPPDSSQGCSPSVENRALNIVPRRGMAVVHFPSTTIECGCIPDPRTLHESEVAVDPKAIVQQFIWPVPIDLSAGVHDDVRAEWTALLASARSLEGTG